MDDRGVLTINQGKTTVAKQPIYQIISNPMLIPESAAVPRNDDLTSAFRMHARCQRTSNRNGLPVSVLTERR